jgi:hypothetical protein
MRTINVFLFVLILTGLLVIFGFVPQGEIALIDALLYGGSWFNLFRLGQFLSSGIWLLPVGGLMSVLFKSDSFIWYGLSTTIAYTFINLWRIILQVGAENPVVPAPFNYFAFGIITFLLAFGAVEWARGKS